MSEIWELVDENKKKTGILFKRENAKQIPKGLYHLVVDIWTKNGNGEILLTQRHPSKEHGLLWECSGGSVVAGEESIEGAVRELREETGLLANPNSLIYLGDTIKSNSIVESYLFVIDEISPKLYLQENEVIAAKFVTLSEMEHLKNDIVDTVWERFCQFRSKF
ncbi:MAG: NUDIX domain-containing protein [Acutalibacteraceae bacterium]